MSALNIRVIPATDGAVVYADELVLTVTRSANGYNMLIEADSDAPVIPVRVSTEAAGEAEFIL